MLARYGEVYGMELDETARLFASDFKLGDIQPGCLPDDIPFPDKTFDLIVLLDVLEHLEDDTASLQALSQKLKPSGWLLITVPAYPWLWTRQDELLHHKRRYLRRNLQQVVGGASYRVHFSSYFNFFLFPLITGGRLLLTLLNKNEDELVMPPDRMNQLLTNVFAFERYLIPRLFFPFGVSIMLLAQRNELDPIAQI